MQSMIEMAIALTEAVGRLREHARLFFYRVMLSGYMCPRCDSSLVMVKEGECRCICCGAAFDPTITFQRCDHCSGQLRLQVRRYRCIRCDADIRSRFLFDGLVFDTAYFRQKMAESRERKRELREQVKKMLAGSRSGLAEVPAANLSGAADLLEALNTLVQQTSTQAWRPERERFDLTRYQSHVQAHLGPIPVSLRQIPPLSEDARKDLIWRFIAILFLDHAGIAEIWQDGQEIMVMQRETDTKGQGVPGDLEAAA